jgi:hypothetical protein
MASAAEWGVRFQEQAAEAGRSYARVARRYDELLERVARGGLAPEDVQRQLRDYVQEHAATSTRELVELSVGLLAGLLYVEARYRDALLDGLVPPAPPVPPPPAPAGVDLTRWFQALAAYATEQGARAAQRYQALVELVASGQLPTARVQEEGRLFAERRSPEFLGEVMDLGLTFVGRLQRSSTGFAEALYDRILGPEPDVPPPGPPLCADLRGPAGSLAVAAIVVENTLPTAADVSCRASDFAPRGGGPPFRSGLEVSPARFTLAPGAQRELEVRLLLDPALFAPGTDHAALLRISGAGEQETIVQLLARADASAPERPASTGPAPGAAAPKRPARSARKRR